MTKKQNPGCVHEEGAPNVQAETEYSLLGGVMLMTGITALPKLVRFRCGTCGRLFAESSDREIRRKYVTA